MWLCKLHGRRLESLEKRICSATSSSSLQFFELPDPIREMYVFGSSSTQVAPICKFGTENDGIHNNDITHRHLSLLVQSSREERQEKMHVFKHDSEDLGDLPK